MSLASERLDYQSSSTPSPDILSKRVEPQEYKNCIYRHGQYCCSKICTLTILLISTTVIAIAINGLSLWMDNWAGISTNPNATLDLPYPRLGPKYLDYVIFNKTIPNDNGTLYQYIDETLSTVRFTKSRFGLLSNCKSAITGPQISLFKTPWKAPVCRASWDEYQCPIVAMRTTRGAEPRAPLSLTPMHGCIKLTQVCDGNIDCPSGHDELNCAGQLSSDCGLDMVHCSNNKKICIPKSSVCDGFNDCGMYEDEMNCCGRVGFLRCADGSCVMGERCDAKADCFDLSDEYDCPDPLSEYYTKCSDGQLIESTYMCERKEYASFQCRDLSDETTRCDYDNVEPLVNNPAMLRLKYDKSSKCFKQSFTFETLNETMLKRNYPDEKQRKFAETYEFSIMRLVIVISIGVALTLCALSVLLLLCLGTVTKRCKSMRITFISLSIIYLICLVQTLLTGLFWVNFVSEMNDIMENPAESDIYEQVAIETIKVTGGLASIRISTHLTFYNSGFFGLAFLLSVIAAQLIKHASCHIHRSKEYEGTYHPRYLDDQLAANHSLLGNNTDNSDNGIPTPDQIIPPHRSFRSLDKHCTHSASDTALRAPYQWSNGNTYISYKDPLDSIDRSDKLITRTLDRNTIRYTQV